MARLPAGPQ